MSDPIKTDPEVLSGAPVFTGTTVPVKNLFDYLREGKTLVEFLKDFPDVKREQVLRFLKDVQNEAK